MKHARDRGFKVESVFPDVPENHNRVPPADAWLAEPVAKLGRWSRIQGENDPTKLRDGILNAFRLLERGMCSPPGAVIEVGTGFAALRDDEAWNGDLGTSWGHHDQMIVAYREVDDCVAFASSWGGEQLFWMSIPLLAVRGGWFSVIESLVYSESA
jgi:hypothetical protein